MESNLIRTPILKNELKCLGEVNSFYCQVFKREINKPTEFVDCIWGKTYKEVLDILEEKYNIV